MRTVRIAALLPAIFLACLGVLSLLNRASSLHGEDGVVWLDLGEAPEAIGIEAGGPADLAGIRKGDKLLNVDGITPAPTRSIRELLWGREGLPTTFEILRGDQRLMVEVVPRPDGGENRLYYFLFVVGATALAAGSLALVKLPADPAAPSLYGLCLALFAVLALSPGGNGGGLDWIFYWGDLAGRLLLPPFIIHFFFRLGEPAERFRPGWSRRIWLYAPATLLLGMAIYLIPLRGALNFGDPAKAIRLKDRLELSYLAVYAIAAVSLLAARLWSSTRARTRWRLRWVAASAAAGLLPLSLLYLLPVALGLPAGTLGELSVLPLAVAPLGFAASLFQERTVDLDRSLRAAVRWLVAGAVFLAGGAVCSWLVALLPHNESPAGILTEVVLPLLVSFTLAALFYRSLGQSMNRLLGRRPPGISRLLLELSEDIGGEVRLEPLARKLMSRLESAFDVRPVLLLVEGATRGSYLPVRGREGSLEFGLRWSLSEEDVRRLSGKELLFLEDQNAGLPPPAAEAIRMAGFRYLFPMIVQGEMRAALLSGPRRDGSVLEGEELDTMAALAAQAARGVEAARLYREIEERSQREARLRRETEAILECSRIGILLSDAAGRITAANGAVARILGHSDPVGRGVGELLPKGLLMLLDRAGRDVRDGGSGERVFRYSFGAVDGATRVVNATRSQLGKDFAAGRVYTLDDVTEEVRREEKMVRQDHLAAMGLLASQVAHEVNTPLTGIASYAQMLMTRMKSRLPEMELLKKIESQAFRAAGIAGSVLNFARRKEEDPAQVFDPGPVVTESLALFEPHLKGKRIRLAIERAPSLPVIRGHRGRVQQVVLNLLLNAAQALPSGGEIRLALDRDGESVRIRVSDNGVGIPAGELHRIFEPFFTARSDGKGTGLGLSVVQQIVREHEGRIQVESVEGAGSTFTVCLPTAPVVAPEVARGI